MVKIWRVSGAYKKNKKLIAFSKELLAEKESIVRERVLSDIGSRHRVKRRDIVINEIREIQTDEVINPDIRRILSLESK